MGKGTAQPQTKRGTAKRPRDGQGEQTGEMAAKKRSTGKGTRANKKDLYKRGSINYL
jgi:hypothetical protein